MITKFIQENAHKFAYLVKEYPEKTAQEIINMIYITKADVNCAVWAAVELGLISDVDPETQKSTYLKAPKKWEFGENVQAIEDALTYAFTKLGDQEKDMEENYLAEWTTGYFPHDTLIAVKHLLEEKILFEYELKDVDDSVYIFYTLKENAGQEWGRKQFKVDIPEAEIVE